MFGSSQPLSEVTNICSGPLEGVTTCTEDFGAPLAQAGPNNSSELAGVVTWVFSLCGYRGIPSVYTKISGVVDFIEANVPDLQDAVAYLNKQ